MPWRETLLFPPKLYDTCSINLIEASRIIVDCVFGRIWWLDATRYNYVCTVRIWSKWWNESC